MKRILVATDFSDRSERAVRRAALLAGKARAQLAIVHAINDDQPARKVEAENRAATEEIEALARALRHRDSLACEPAIVAGPAPEAIVAAAAESNADIIVVGQHRRRPLRDIFVGTTAERAVRASSRPVLEVNANPETAYRHVLVAIDMSDGARKAVRSLRALGLDRDASVSVVHVFDALGTGVMAQASMSMAEIKTYIADQKKRADGELDAFLKELSLQPARRELALNEATPGTAICAAAGAIGADLIVVGTKGRTGAARVLLGSVAEYVLGHADCDVLAVPARDGGQAG